VLIEVKLATNAEARRAVVAQLLGYAAHLRGLSAEELEEILRPHLKKQGHSSLVDAAKGSDQEGLLDPAAFRDALNECLARGSFRLVFVLDSAPTDLVKLVGYLEAISRDDLVVDLITVANYHIGPSEVLVPQRIDPERIPEVPSQAKSNASVTVAGGNDFIEAIKESPEDHQKELFRLAGWATELEKSGLAKLYTSHGKSRKTLVPRIVGQDAGFCTIWNDNGAYLSLWRTVFEREAPRSLVKIEQILGAPIGQGTTAKPLTDELLESVRAAYQETQAAGKKGLPG